MFWTIGRHRIATGNSRRIPNGSWTGAVLAIALAAGCTGDDGDTGPPGLPGPSGSDTNTLLEQGDTPPGVNVGLVSFSGGSGAGGSFQVGDKITARFTLTKDDGSAWDITEMSTGRALVSGPSFNYQRVIPEVTNVATAAVLNADGSYSFTFATAIPGVYAAPLNDTPTFGTADGELTGQPLLAGTYTCGLYFAWNYTVDGESHRDVGNTTANFLFGGATTMEHREAVLQENCNSCHQDLQAHGGLRREVTLCLLCHTAGAEDKNAASAAGGTPDVTIEFKVMIHRIHAGKHLPSVLGVDTNPDGSRDYGATPKPYQIVGFGNSIHDFSEIGFPVMPSAYVAYLFDKPGTTYLGTGGNGPMPRDTGYSALSLTEKELEDRLRTAPVACDKCHGDPDGAGPLPAPAQGDLYKSQPSRNACGSCHDDINWGLPYTSNAQTMPAQANNANCVLCHEETGMPLGIEDAHRHPYSNPVLNTGIEIDITSVAGGTGGGGNHQAGDPIEVTFGVQDGAGTDRQIHQLTRFQMIVTGPSKNQQLVLPNLNVFDFAFRKSTPFTGNGTASTPVVSGTAMEETIAVVFTGATTFDILGSVSPPASGLAIGAAAGSTAGVDFAGVAFTLTQGSTAFAAGDRFYFDVVPLAVSYTRHVPRDISFERLGTATGGADSMPVGNVPIYWGRQTVFERTALVGAPAPTSEDAAALGRYLPLDSSLLPGLAVADRVVVGDGTPLEEYLTVGRIQTTDDMTGADLGDQDRIWFTSPLRYAHAIGALVQEVTLSSRREGLQYTLATSGATEIVLVAGKFSAGNPVVASYRTHGRFGYFPGPGEPLQAVHLPAAADSDEIDFTWGDWRGLPLVDGTYTVGMWANKDFTVTPLGQLAATGLWSNLNTDETTYRMISSPATRPFLFGSATQITTNTIISSPQSCNQCHSDVQAHGFGRRGLETCLLCHSTSGMEDGPPYTFSSWYVGPTPGVTMDFRTLLHKVHMGKELANASTFEVNGVFLGTPYPVDHAEVGFPAFPQGTKSCETCHGAGNQAWKAPADRDHPLGQPMPVREWRAVCGACHDASEAQAHIDLQTSTSGFESCSICHGPGKEWNVQKMHVSY